MSRILLGFILIISAASSYAGNWPWQDSPDEPIHYCRGFISGGLDSAHVEGKSRTGLWLAWNYMIRSIALEESSATAEYQAGQEKFLQIADAGTAHSIVEEADGSCGLGRRGHQITGW